MLLPTTPSTQDRPVVSPAPLSAYVQAKAILATTAAAFRIDQIAAADLNRLWPTHRRSPPDAGVSLPTCDPRQPQHITGLIRLTRAQDKHGFASAAVGLACPVDLAEQSQVVLVDGPWLGLRLHQAGVRGIALVEDAAVLPPLRDWLATKQVILLATKHQRLATLQQALGDLPVQSLVVPGDLTRIDAATWTVLGISGDERPQRAPAPARTLQDLRDVLAFGQAQVSANEGAELLSAMGITPDFAASFAIGYLPLTISQRFPRHRKAAWTGARLGNSVIVPAVDEQGAVVDALVVHAGNELATDAWLGASAGLLGATAITAYKHLVVVDFLRRAAVIWAAGERNVIILRDGADAERNAARMRAAGVRSVELRTNRWAEAIATALRAVGITVTQGTATRQTNVDSHASVGAAALDVGEADEALVDGGKTSPASCQPNVPEHNQVAPVLSVPAPAVAMTQHVTTVPSTALIFVEIDQRAQEAHYCWRDCTLVVQLPWAGTAVRRIAIRRGTTGHQDRFDPAQPAQRLRFAEAAAVCLRLPIAALSEVVAEAVADVAQRPDSPDTPTLPVMVHQPTTMSHVVSGGYDALASASVARNAPVVASTTTCIDTTPVSTDVTATLLDALTALGWIGDDQAKRLALLAIIAARQTPLPLILRGPAALTGPAMAALAQLLPDPQGIMLSRTMARQLSTIAATAATGSVLLVADPDRLPAEARHVLRSLLAGGLLTTSAIQRDATKGRLRSERQHATANLGLIATASAATEFDDLAIVVHLDQSPAAIQAARRAQNAAASFPPDPDQVQRQVAAARHALRMLPTARVLVPFAERIEFPATTSMHSTHYRHLLAAVTAQAFLHQAQRLRHGAWVVAAETDLIAVAALLTGLIGGEQVHPSPTAQRILAVLMHEQVSETTVPQLLTMLPGWARTTVRDGLDDLIDLGLVASPSMGRGRRERVYAVLPDAVATTTAVPAIRLRDLAPLPDLATDTAEMAELAGNGGTPSANISPALTTGCSEMAEMAAEMLPSQDSAPDRNRLPFPSPPNRTRVLPQQHQGEIAHAG